MGHHAKPFNQSLEEYKNRISNRMDYLRTKRQTLAVRDFSPNRDIMINSIGSAVPVEEMSGEPQVKQILKMKKSVNEHFVGSTKYQNEKYQVFKDSRYKDLREKFGRTIDSSAYRRHQRIDELRLLNVLKY